MKEKEVKYITKYVTYEDSPWGKISFAYQEVVEDEEPVNDYEHLNGIMI